jgi:hypothetical protein
MKFGPAEGTPEEIKNFFQDNGLKAADYFAAPEAPISAIWFVIPSACVVIALTVLTLFAPVSASVATFIFLVGCVASLWLAVNVQLRFKSAWATGIVAIGCPLLMLVALGLVTPLQMLEEIKSLRK